MPKFKFSFERDYTIREGFNRVIEADTLEQAQATAHNLAVMFNDDCPDDCSESDGGAASDFEAVNVPVGNETADYDADGAPL